eukprot:TRINITY_DN27_c0_g1_i1.p1 TRINITY_DN27_c0_g1~~TRINITY_DN27_c0_g1_i1.p1  ORF type:complete len:436 (-),score=188.81 TRINITY_DN27_c0_g1_i1:77-1384(-)
MCIRDRVSTQSTWELIYKNLFNNKLVLFQIRMEAFNKVTLAPPDPILGTAIAYKNDPVPLTDKINLGIGAYRDDNGNPYVFKAVKKAEDFIVQANMNKEYLPIEGLAEYNSAAQKLLFGDDNVALKEKRIATLQSLSGTGALFVGFQFLHDFAGLDQTAYYSEPTWGNHIAIMKRCGFKPASYVYYKPATRGFDFEGMCESLNKMPEKSCVLLHVCAHNPTGVDPTLDQWKIISKIMKEKKLFPFFDSAYQGFATGDLVRDGEPIRIFQADGHQMVVSQSFAKNAGMYGERIGAIHFVCPSAEVCEKVLSQAKIVARQIYSNPPLHGARILSKILNDPALKKEWIDELKQVSGRIIEMRKLLRTKLEELKVPGTWNHITDQIGMFSYTGLNEAQCTQLIEKHHIYLLKNGRISMAGVNTKNVDKLAKAIHDVKKD